MTQQQTSDHEHIVKSFDEELDQMKSDILRMGGLVEAHIASAMEALVKRDPELAQRTIDADKAIDKMEYELNERAMRILALRQPMANDLREVIAALKITTDLERIGDHATNIAKRSLRLMKEERYRGVKGVRRLNDLAQVIVKDVLDSYADKNGRAALDAWRKDAEIDDYYVALFREYLTYMMEDPRTIGPAIEFLFIAKNIERMGDHATNIAETVHYLITGEQFAGLERGSGRGDRPQEDRLH